MEILQQTHHQLVIGTPASALWLVRLIGLAIALPAWLVLLMYVLSGAADYSALNCQRRRPSDRQCRFVRISLVGPVVHHFAIATFQSVNLQTQPQRSPTRAQVAEYRLQLQLSDRQFPLSRTYSRRRQQQLTRQTQIQTFMADPAAPALIIRDWPNLGGFILVGIFLIPTLPLSLLVIGLAATPVTISFDKTQQQITATTKGIFGHDHQHCSFADVDCIVVQTISVGEQRHHQTPTTRYALLIKLRSGASLLRYDYLQPSPANHIAHTMRQFLAAAP